MIILEVIDAIDCVDRQQIQQQHEENSDSILCAGIPDDATITAGDANTQRRKQDIQEDTKVGPIRY